MKTTRLPIQKTIKQYVGGKFIRSESGRTLPHTSARGEAMHICQGSRKDLRNAMRIARGAVGGWAGRSAFNRGQILYRIGEMLEDRTFPGTTGADVAKAADRAVFHAGWADKITAILGSLNPVQQAYVNYSMVRPLGVVLAVPDPNDGLLGLVEATCDALVMGNSVILLVPVQTAELALAYAEALHTSDVPAGVVNILTGDLDELVPVANTLEDLDALWVTKGVLSDALVTAMRHDGAQVLRRIALVDGAKEPAPPHVLQKLSEVKTVWMSSGGDITGGASY